MAATLTYENDVWCPVCKTSYGKIFRKEIRDGVYQTVTQPAKIQKRCSVCEGVLVRK